MVRFGPFSTRARLAGVAAALVIGALGVRSGLGFAMATVQPALAYQIDSSNAEAVAGYANLRVQTAQTEADALAVRETARDGLRASPYAPYALRSYALATVAIDGEDVAAPMLATAGRLTLRDYLTHAWLFDKRYRENAIPAALREADIVLTQRQASADIVIPPLLTLLSDRRTIDPLATALARRPVWRERFLEEMGLQPEDRDAKFALLAAIKAKGAPASTVEMTPYFNSFAADTEPAELRRRWNLLVGRPVEDARVGLIDGEFDAVGSLPPPFAWRLYTSQEIYSEVLERGDGQGKALFASYNGRENSLFASQFVLLPAGRYRMAGQMLGEEGVRPDEYRWQIYCGARGDNEPIAVRTLRPSTEAWSAFSFEFEVPQNCPGQLIALLAHRSGPPRASTLWVDSLSVDAN